MTDEDIINLTAGPANLLEKEIERSYLATLHTIGDSLWTDGAERRVFITKLTADCNEDAEFGELRVYFDKAYWDVYEVGLIYTDSLFLRELKVYLESQGIATDDLSYSEQGMQGDDFVSLDIGTSFIDSWKAKGFEIDQY